MPANQLKISDLNHAAQGKPSQSIYALQDGCFIVRASSQDLVRYVNEEDSSELITHADCRCIVFPEHNSQSWLAIIPCCSSLALDWSDVSKKLNTLGVHLFFDSNSGMCGSQVWDRGECVEYLSLGSTEFDEFREETLHVEKAPRSNHSMVIEDEDGSVESRITFQSSLCALRELDLHAGLKVLDERFQELRVPFYSEIVSS